MVPLMKKTRSIITLLALSLFLFSAAHTHAANDAKAVQTVKLTVEGMCCAGCLTDIENSLTGVTGVSAAKATFEPPEATVTFDRTKTTISALIKAIGKVGYVAKEKPADKKTKRS